jgi:DNA-binding beta-propeller fold protein YncE
MQERQAFRAGCWTWLIIATGLALAAGGCGKSAGVIFEPLANPIVWPGPPAQPRISYVGQLATSADLKPAVPFGQSVARALFGREPIKSMLTPYSVCTDGKDRLFVADSNAQFVHVFNLKTRVYEQWKPPEKTVSLSQPVGVAWNPAGKLYVSDSVGGHICIFDSAGRMIGVISNSFVTRPCGMAFDAKTHRLFVADPGTHQLRVFSDDGLLIARVGERGLGLGKFNYPTNVAVDSQGRVYVSDSLNFRVQQFGPDLQPIRQIGRKGDLPGYFSQPKGIAVDSQDHLYVIDANFEAIEVFDSNGSLLMDFGTEGVGPGEFWLPSGIFIDSRNRIWIADSYNRRVQVLDYLMETKP